MTELREINAAYDSHFRIAIPRPRERNDKTSPLAEARATDYLDVYVKPVALEMSGYTRCSRCGACEDETTHTLQTFFAVAPRGGGSSGQEPILFLSRFKPLAPLYRELDEARLRVAEAKLETRHARASAEWARTVAALATSSSALERKQARRMMKRGYR